MDGTTATALDKVLGVVPDLFSFAGTCVNAVLDNPILLLYFAVPMIGVGLGVFNMMKHTAQG